MVEHLQAVDLQQEEHGDRAQNEQRDLRERATGSHLVEPPEEVGDQDRDARGGHEGQRDPLGPVANAAARHTHPSF